MNDKLNKTSICNVVAIEIIDYSKKTEGEQTELKNQLNGFIQHAVIDLPQEDREIVDTISGVHIACTGTLEDALEDALFVSITIRDEILKNNTDGAIPLYVHFGINLGAVRTLKKGLVGVGMDEAQRIMSFAEPNQILVSQGYFDVASKLTQEMAQMFEKYEMHAHEHDIYAVRLLKEAATEEAPSIPVDSSDSEAQPSIVSKINWNYVGLSFLALAGFFILGKLVSSPTEPTIILEQPVATETPKKLEAAPVVLAKPVEEVKPAQDKVIENAVKKEEPKKAKVVQKKPQQKAETLASKSEKATAEKLVESKVEKSAVSKPEKATTVEKSSWEAIKESVQQGSERKCSQAEIAMNQCR